MSFSTPFRWDAPDYQTIANARAAGKLEIEMWEVAQEEFCS